ncbi:DNA polymerase alpha catalytic subunit [Bonamia ostreae]|uniref:DNA polymerase alpha catalytic subunit n=1 Tax=Bonamia ostreae TaxID=126728 RepID=A0ABV2AI86_9EUKA
MPEIKSGQIKEIDNHFEEIAKKFPQDKNNLNTNSNQNVVKSDNLNEFKSEKHDETKINEFPKTDNSVSFVKTHASFEENKIEEQECSDENIRENEIKNDPVQNTLKKLENLKDCLIMYWIDAFEDFYTRPGTIFLFGKVL